MLKLLALGVSNPIDFDYMDRPDSAAIRQSIAALEFLEAVTKRGEGGNEYALTDLGKLMSVFPMDPRLSKVVLCYRAHRRYSKIISLYISVDYSDVH